ncbi:glycine betaine ABC transporter substrate-binding protein [Clostridium frigidicarnis]|uniref:Osmoprotectant transport system permease protein n=1 Tax=Clostridium frigidicarnis TaxID=84698 RepID=A0A1I0XR16_9CLOT|nr:glycine betaine ABC transporter substrate-binding protein [Clostridium frigidicarnis]SFB03485.1 osmoprotectant transport system permease protein [Clostridium frigidicarnis]
MISFFEFIISRKEQILELFFQHIYLTFVAIFIAILIGIPIGILITKTKSLRKPVLGFINLMQAVPSMALLGLLIPILGIGGVPAITMVVLYSLLPIVKNTYTGLSNINENVLESARGMGLTSNQTLRLIKLPLALPLIMSGVRISAVTSVGLMTLAAFIGAGGLGYLVFSGIQTVNNNMILAGAIPSCILALLIDYLFGKIEVMVTPRGLNPQQKKSKSTGVKVVLSIILLTFLVTSFLSFIKPKKDTIVVGSKNFSEQLVLGNMVSDLIEEYTDFRVDRKLNLGGSSIGIAAMKSGEIDVFVDYVGTLLINVLEEPVIKNPDKAYLKAKELMEAKYKITLLEPLGFNNTYTLAMKPETADKYNIKTISDLSKVSKDFVFSPTLEFENREDGFIGLSKDYNLKFKNVAAMDGSLRYSALKNDKCQVVDAFSTDGLLKSFNLKVLEDDRSFFPPYHAVPLVREEILEKHPELKDVLNKLEGVITNEVMTNLNYKVDELGEAPEAVAKEFLQSQNLVE